MNTSKTTSGRSGGPSCFAWWTLALALISGGMLRWIWIEDMEWKKDERWSYQMSQELGRTRPWSFVGMDTSVGFPNPGLSVWIFVPIGRVASTPTSMARAIAVLNMLGLIGFAAVVRIFLPARAREPWLWGLALQAVSPFAIRMSRKIWPPSILTPFLLVLWVSHRFRLARWGAFTWGLVGAVIGQVHLSGWFVALGLVVGTVVAEWRGWLPRSHYWHWWLSGTALGLTLAVSWARLLWTSAPSLLPGFYALMFKDRALAILYGLAGTASSALPYQILGIGNDLQPFLVGPVIDGVPLHFYDALILFILMVSVARLIARLIDAIAAVGRRWSRRTMTDGIAAHPHEDASVSAAPARTADEGASTGFYLWSTLAIPCVVQLVTINVHFYHYYFVFCPFLFVFVAVFMLPWRRVLVGLVVAQALMGVCFLTYIHQRGGAHGEYGITYARQGNR